MPLIQCLCSFALRQVSLEGADKVIGALTNRFSDQSQRLTHALERANRRAWDALHITLAGESFWNRFNSAEDKAFRTQLRAFLDAMSLPELEGKEHYRRQCLQDLNDARRKGLLFGHVVAEDLAQRAGAFARHTDPAALLQVERKALLEMANELYQAGFKALGWLLGQPAHPGQSVIVVAVRYFFRREIETDDVLARGVQFEITESLSREQQASFRQLESVLQTHGQRVETALAGLLEVAGQTLDKVDEVRGLAHQILEHLQMKNQPVRPQHSLSIRNDRERQLVKDLLARYRALPDDQRRAAPELLNDVGKLQVAVGDFDAAEASFVQVAALSRDSATRAEAHHNAYQAALERGDRERALKELRQALAIDPQRFAPFPLDDYEPERILGAGGFGVTFLCRHRLSGGQVAVKALATDDLERDANTVMQEAAALDHLSHSGIIRLRHCGYADTGRTRPYLVMEYFEGQTLEEYVAGQGRGGLPLETVLPLAILVARALQAAHGKGILHRDVKPANILLRRSRDAGGPSRAGRWEVKLIDFGLALKQNVLAGGTSTARQGKTVMSSSIAGTLDYAAPEQMGRLPGVRVGPPADIYGFAKTVCYALFEATDPTPLDWRKVPAELAELLGHCLARRPEERPASFGEVLNKLEALRAGTAKKSRPEEVPVLTPVPQGPPQAIPLPPRPVAEAPPSFATPHLPFHTTTGKRIADALLALCFGWFGAHKFSQGNNSAGWTRFGISCTCIGLYVTALIGVIECVLYLVKSNEEYDQLYLVEKKGWF